MIRLFPLNFNAIQIITSTSIHGDDDCEDDDSGDTEWWMVHFVVMREAVSRSGPALPLSRSSAITCPLDQMIALSSILIRWSALPLSRWSDD